MIEQSKPESRLGISLKSKMTVAVTLLTAVLLASTGWGLFEFFRQELQSSISRQQFTLVTALGAEIDSKIRTAQEHLLAVAGMVTPELLTDRKAAGRFLELQGDNQLLFDNGLVLFSPQGRVLAAVQKESYRCADGCPFEVYLRRTLEAKAPQISEPFFSTQENPRPVVMFTAPVFGADGQVAAIMTGSVDLLGNNFLGQLGEIRLGEGGYLYLFNQERTIIVHPERNRILKQDVPPGANGMFDKALEGFEGTGVTVNSRRLHTLSSFRRLPTTGWILAANYPVAEAFAPLAKAKQYFFPTMVGMLLLASLAVWLLMRQLTFPLLRLTQRVLAVEKTAEMVASPDRRGDEIDILSRAFSQMLERVEEHRQDLQHQLRFLQVLIDAMPNPIFFKDAGGRYLGCNRAFEAFVGSPRSKLVGKSVFDLAPHDLAEVYHRADAELFDRGAGEVQTYESSALFADGSRHEVIFYKATFPDADGRLGGLVGTLFDISERKKAEGQLRKLSRAVQQSPNVVVVTDARGSIEYVNPMFTQVTGYTPEEAIGQNSRLLNAGDTPAEYFRTLWETITAGHEWRGEFHNRKKNGEFYWENALISPLKTPEGTITHFVAVKEDITARKLAERRQKLTAQVFSLLSLPNEKTDKIRDILQLVRDFTGCEAVGIRLRENGDFPYYRTLGLTDEFLDAEKYLHADGGSTLAESLCGKVLLGLTEQSRSCFTPGGSFWLSAPVASAPDGPVGHGCLCARGRCQGESFRSMALIPLRSGEEIIGLMQLLDRRQGMVKPDLVQFLETLGDSIGIAFEHQQVEERLLEKEDRLNFLANYDPLTRLPNRSLLCDRLQHAMARARRSDQSMALLVLDLDRFKTINDSLGHEVGDRILLEVAHRLKGFVREVDTLARFGGDKFAIILEEVADLQKVVRVAQKVLSELSRTMTLDEFQLYVTASIGISFFPSDGADLESLLQHAEAAMYRAKETGRNQYQFYRPEMNARTRERLLLENSLRQAVEKQQLILYYQPKIDLASGQMTGVEALLRWRHPDLGMVSPDDFIPLAEETGLIVSIGEWVLRTACGQARTWQKSGLPPLRVAVNISGRQFRQTDFVDMVEGVLTQSGLDPQYLELEITESVAMENVEETIETLTALKERGLCLAIDDFGTGYSSLSYLKRFPITSLKIDRSFINEVGTDPNDAAIASSVIALAQAMSLKVVAEGIETEEQLRFLVARGCTEGQGFLFSRPVPPVELALFLASWTKERDLPADRTSASTSPSGLAMPTCL
jgi:diguanylate cyclase (GGDEF)-like protein/PAS domain S-box-containing protein